MIAMLTGKIQEIYPDYLVLEVNHIGYKIIMPNPYAFTKGEDVMIHTYLNVREDALNLYGFKTLEMKSLFERLISVTGIGPKSACAILAGGEVEDVVSAIERADSAYLMKFPKVGPKTAQQIILDLRGKLTAFEQVTRNAALDEAVEALKALGYTEREINRVTKLLTKEEGLSTQGYITKALQLMLK